MSDYAVAIGVIFGVTSKAISAASSRISSKPAWPTIRGGLPAVATRPIPPRSGAPAAHCAADRRSAAAVKKRSQRASRDKLSRKAPELVRILADDVADVNGRAVAQQDVGTGTHDEKLPSDAEAPGGSNSAQAVVPDVAAASALGVAAPRESRSPGRVTGA